MPLSSQCLLTLITIKTSWPMPEFSWLWSFLGRSCRWLWLHSLPHLLLLSSAPLTTSPPLSWSEVKPDQLVKERGSVFVESKWERENEDVWSDWGSHRLLFTPAWQVILLNKATHAQRIRDIHGRGECERQKVEAQVIVHLAFTKVLNSKVDSKVNFYGCFSNRFCSQPVTYSQGTWRNS